MKYEVILEKGEYALIKRGIHMNEYAIVYGLDKTKGEWGRTVCYVGFGKYSPCTESQALSFVLEIFRSKTENNYISRFRLEELATKFKDGLFGANLESEEYEEFFLNECKMETHELDFFEIETESEDE